MHLRTAVRRMIVLAAIAGVPAGCASAGGKAPTGPAITPMATADVGAGWSSAGNYLAGRFAADVGDSGQAADLFSRALAADPENVELLQRAFALTAAEGRMDEAGTLARRLLQFDSSAVAAVILVAVQEAAAGDFKAAERRLQGLPERGLSSFLGPLLTAWTRVGQGDVDGALARLAPLAENTHFRAMHDFHAALIADFADRRDTAAFYYRKTATGAGAPALRYVQAAASFFQRSGQPEEAHRLFADYRRDRPDGSLLDDGPAFPADPRKEVPSAAAGMAEALFGAATSLRQTNALEAGLILARLGLHLQADFPLARILVADILQTRGDLAGANSVYGTIRPGDIGYWAAQLRLAANLDTLGDETAAVERLRAMADQHPERIDALVALGEILRVHKRHAEAVAAYDEAIARLDRIEPRHWVLYYSRGMSLERSGQWPRAERDLQRALELEPDQPHVLNYLGYSWVEQGVNVEAAKRMIEKAVELRPNDGYIIDSLGWVLFRIGDYDGAVAQLERAVELRPEDPTINDHLGDALWRVGRFDEARFQWQRTLALQPEADQVDGIRGKIAAGLEGKTAAGPGQ